MCVKPQPGEKVVPVRCQPKTYPCPSCGRHGHRKRRLDRFVRSLDYGRGRWLHVFYAEYTARCDCRKSFRSWVPNSCPKANYDNLRDQQKQLNRETTLLPLVPFKDAPTLPDKLPGSAAKPDTGTTERKP